MCGIVGILAPKVSLELLENVTASLAHRGPDDSGTVLRREPSFEIGLGHRRLAILDLSPLGHQPMQDPVNGNWIVFNGEIYNFRELQKELEIAGFQFRSHCDTEVLLAAYRAWGESCLTRINGMFALAIWDVAAKRLLLARDPMGIKPLYYYQSGQTFVFSSEIRTLLRTGFVPPKLDTTGLLSFLEFGSVCEPWTIVEGIRAVPAGSVLTVEKGSVTIREYWSPLQVLPQEKWEASCENGSGTSGQLSPIIRDAVLSQLVSDVPVGVFLSGGIDSSALVAVLHKNGVRANTFSLVFDEKQYNEAPYSREIARRFGTAHEEIAISEKDILEALPDALRAMDQPTIDGVNTYLVSAKTRAAGVKVALTGLGADEMFAGYSNFRRVPRMEGFSTRLERLPKTVRSSLSSTLKFFAGKDRSRKVAELLSSSNESAVHPYFLARTLFGGAERLELFCGDQAVPARELVRVLQKASGECRALDPVNQVSYLESSFYMRNTLLRDSDFMSMAHGLELRVPFLDRALVQTCFRIPGDQKLEGNSPKSLLLANLGVELPAVIVSRPKRGFTLPFEKWLRGEMRGVLEESLLRDDQDKTLINTKAARAVWKRFLGGSTSWSRPWSLFVLHRWCEQNL